MVIVATFVNEHVQVAHLLFHLRYRRLHTNIVLIGPKLGSCSENQVVTPADSFESVILRQLYPCLWILDFLALLATFVRLQTTKLACRCFGSTVSSMFFWIAVEYAMYSLVILPDYSSLSVRRSHCSQRPWHDCQTSALVLLISAQKSIRCIKPRLECVFVSNPLLLSTSTSERNGHYPYGQDQRFRLECGRANSCMLQPTRSII
jgi:hypothetical protein